MNVSLYQAAAALDANSDWQDVMAENLASSSVPGFRKQAMVTEAVAGLSAFMYLTVRVRIAIKSITYNALASFWVTSTVR